MTEEILSAVDGQLFLVPDRRGPGVLDAGGIRNGGDRIYQSQECR